MATGGPAQISSKYKPEDRNQMVVKPHCECTQCHHWTSSADWCPTPNMEFETDKHKSLHKNKKIQPLLRSNEYPGKKPKIITFDYQKMGKIERLSAFKLILHGEIIPQPVKLLTDTYFHDEIQATLKQLNYQYSLPIQSFIWPALFRQQNVFMINGRNSGKTVAYLPVICTFALNMDKKYREFAKYRGPLIVIICPNSKQCEAIFDLIHNLMATIHPKPKICTMTYPIKSVNNMDILITIPQTLMECLKTRMFNMKRLCHLVLEDTSTLLKTNGDSIFQFLKMVDNMLSHRAHNINVQLIATAEKWTPDLKKLLQSIYITPFVCIGNHLEGALYGNCQIEFKFLMSDKKKIYLESLLKNKYHIYKTIVVCNENEISDVNIWLIENGIATVALNDSATKEEIEAAEEMWTYTQGGQYKVLICTNSVFDTLLSINDAMWFVNYSFPNTWSRFVKRFGVIAAHLHSPLEENKDKNQCKSFIMIDETNDLQMTKILNLLNRLNKNLPSEYQQYADGFKVEYENGKVLAKIPLCEKLKLFGKCSNSLCENRHIINEKLDMTNELPKNGKVTFKILAIKGVVQYYAQLLTHTNPENRKITTITTDNLKEPLIYAPSEEKKQAAKIETGKFYAYCEYTRDNEIFTMCQVVFIQNETFVEVKLPNGVIMHILQKQLFELPRHLKVIEIYISNLIPPYQDEYFSGRALQITRTSLETLNYKNIVLTGDIYLQLDRTLFLQNVVQMVEVAQSEIVKLNFTKHLMNIGVVEKTEYQMSSLHKLCVKSGIILPEYNKTPRKKKIIEKEEEPQRAFLDDTINEVILSSAVTPEEFYVRLAKYQTLLQNLEDDLQKAAKMTILNKNVNPTIGKYYLAPDPQGERLSRALILNIKDGKALCFYVDYGDEAVVNLDQLQILPSKFIKKLPFQAIQCRLHGIHPTIDKWECESTDIFYKYMFEPDSDIFRPLFVKKFNEHPASSIRTKTLYSVLLKDGFDDKNILINQLLIDSGFASSNEKFEDFEVPKLQIKQDDLEESDSGLSETNNDISQINDNFDFVIFDEGEFLKTFSPFGFRQPNKNKITEDKEHQINSLSMVPSTINQTVSDIKQNEGILTPEVYWSQTENTVKLKIKLIGVDEYKTTVVQNRIFTFWAKLKDRRYELKFLLHKTAKKSNDYATGQEVKIILSKIENVEWSQLTNSQKRMRYIHYELLENEPKQEKKKFLTLGISDEESDGNDNIMVHEVSDMDSEFDEEAISSSSDN